MLFKDLNIGDRFLYEHDMNNAPKMVKTKPFEKTYDGVVYVFNAICEYPYRPSISFYNWKADIRVKHVERA